MNWFQKLKTNVAAFMMNCRAASRAQSELLDHPLPRATRAGLWLHLLMCKWCRRYSQQLQFLHKSCQAHEEKLTQAAPGQLSTAARERIKQRLKD